MAGEPGAQVVSGSLLIPQPIIKKDTAMKLYPLNETDRVVHPELGEFEPTEDGGFDLPEQLGQLLHNTHIGGKKTWETDGERSDRLIREELERRKDPATLLAAVEELIAAQRKPSEAKEEPVKPEKKAPAATKKPSQASAAQK